MQQKMFYPSDNVSTCSAGRNVKVDVSVDDTLPPDVQILKWIFCVEEKEDNSGEQWERAQCNLEKSKKKICSIKEPCIRRNCCGCCVKGPCEREQAVKELFNFLKRMKQNIVTSSCNANGDTSSCKYGSVKPAFVLAHLSVKLSELEEKLQNLSCSKNTSCRLRRLIKYSQRSIIIQFIQGPCVNDLFIKTVSDVAGIERLMKEMVPDAPKTCLCNCVKNTCYCRKKLDRVTSCSREKQGSITSNESLCKTSSFTSTSYTSIKEEPPCKTEVTDKCCQTDNSQSSNTEQYEVTALCVNYSRNRYVNEIDQLPKLAINKIEKVYCTIDRDLDTNITDSDAQTYKTRVDGFNVTAETTTNENLENLNIQFSKDECETENFPGYSPCAEQVLSKLKRDIFLYGGKLATLLLNPKNC